FSGGPLVLCCFGALLGQSCARGFRQMRKWGTRASACVGPRTFDCYLGSPPVYSRPFPQPAIATAAIAAVSARSIVLPSDAEHQPRWRKLPSSASLHPPSGPIASDNSA